MGRVKHNGVLSVADDGTKAPKPRKASAKKK